MKKQTLPSVVTKTPPILKGRIQPRSQALSPLPSFVVKWRQTRESLGTRFGKRHISSFVASVQAASSFLFEQSST